jgi:hypothetical protein
VSGVAIFLVILPLVLIGAAAGAAWVSVHNSSVRITSAAVEIRNYRQPAREIPLERAARFEAPAAVGFLSSLRPRTGVLVLTDDSRLAVRSLREPEAGVGIDALNARLERLRDEA